MYCWPCSSLPTDCSRRAASPIRSVSRRMRRRAVAQGRATASYLPWPAVLLVHAALRFVAVGQLEAGRLLASLRPLIGGLPQGGATADLDEMWSFTPALEIAGVRHAELDARM